MCASCVSLPLAALLKTRSGAFARCLDMALRASLAAKKASVAAVGPHGSQGSSPEPPKDSPGKTTVLSTTTDAAIHATTDTTTDGTTNTTTDTSCDKTP